MRALVLIPLVALLAATSAPAVELHAGDILVAQSSFLGTTPPSPSLILVDPLSGNQTVISGCVDPDCSTVVGTGPLWPTLTFVVNLAIEPSGQFVLVQTLFGIHRVDAATGDRTLVSGSSSSCDGIPGPGPDELFIGLAVVPILPPGSRHGWLERVRADRGDVGAAHLSHDPLQNRAVHDDFTGHRLLRHQ